MVTSFEYVVRQRTSRGTSGHEAEELETLLNAMGRSGWRLHVLHEPVPQQQVLIFERTIK